MKTSLGVHLLQYAAPLSHPLPPNKLTQCRMQTLTHIAAETHPNHPDVSIWRGNASGFRGDMLRTRKLFRTTSLQARHIMLEHLQPTSVVGVPSRCQRMTLCVLPFLLHQTVQLHLWPWRRPRKVCRSRNASASPRNPGSMCVATAVELAPSLVCSRSTFALILVRGLTLVSPVASPSRPRATCTSTASHILTGSKPDWLQPGRMSQP